MKIQRFFALKGGSILYIDKERSDSIPENVRECFKQAPCGEGDIGYFPKKVVEPVTEKGYFVDDGPNKD